MTYSNIEKINGTATVIDNGEVYSTYTAFAKAAGHPDAVYHGKRLTEGSNVQLLAKGKHGATRDRIYVVKDENNVKHLIGEGGLKDIRNTGKFKIGDTVRQLAPSIYGNGQIGDIVTIEEIDYESFRGPGHIVADGLIFRPESLELVTPVESTNTQVERLEREVSMLTDEVIELTKRVKHLENRFSPYKDVVIKEPAEEPDRAEAVEAPAPKFKVGDRVKVITDDPIHGWGYVSKGDIGTVVVVKEEGSLKVDFPNHKRWNGEPEEFELVTFVVGDRVKLTIADGKHPEHGWGSVKNGDIGIVKRVGEYGGLFVDFPAQKSWYGEPHEFTLVTESTTESIAESTDTLRTPTQELRDDVVEKAKQDVAAIIKRGSDVNQIGASEGNRTYRHQFYTVEFVVNAEKRTVVALVKEGYGRSSNSRPDHKGIAKAAPDDCFNVHIGKAIALRRAMELPVLDDYIHAPQPTEVRVGDVVKSNKRGYTAKVLRFCGDEISDRRYGRPFRHTIDGGWLGVEQVTVIDDSREAE